MRLLTLWALAMAVGFSATETRAADAAGKHAGILGGQGQGQAVRQEVKAFRQAVHDLFQAIQNGGDVAAAAQKVKDAWQALPEPVRERIKQARERIMAKIQEHRQGAGRGNGAGAGAATPVAQ